MMLFKLKILNINLYNINKSNWDSLILRKYKFKSRFLNSKVIVSILISELFQIYHIVFLKQVNENIY